jgi:SOS-response transcriptional repressor LexA
MARPKKQKTEPLATVTAQELKRGQAFAAWLSGAIQRVGTNAYQLSQEPGMPSSTYIYWLLDNGISNTGEYKRPSEELVRLFAERLRADLSDGLTAAGYSTHAVPTVPSELALLPADLQHDLADFVRRLRHMPSVVSDMIGSPVTSVRESSAGYYPPPSQLVTLPILGFVGAVGEHFNIFAEEHHEGEITLPMQFIKNNLSERCFIVRVRGNCLAGSLIADGDYAVCVMADTAKDNDIVLVADGDDVILKRFREFVGDEGRSRWLETDEANGDKRTHETEYPPRILGRMIALHREM